jgi:2-dehydropantoate 2-reductase
VEHTAFGVVTVGEQDGADSDRTKRLCELFAAARIPCRVSPDIRHEVWTKFAWNTVFNMLTALGRVTVEKLFEHEAIERLCRDLFEELRRVASVQGVQLSADEVRQIIEEAKKLDGFETSTYQDLKKGKRLEYEAFSGAVVRLAGEYGIEVPHNRTVYALLKLIDRQRSYHRTKN